MPKKWEGSPEDKAIDKAGAKRKGVSLKEWEGSPEDKKLDKKAQARAKPAPHAKSRA